MFFASIFQTLIVKPIFNLLVLIYALLPWHNFGVAIIIFTVIVRLLMWPLVKKQLHQTKVMRQLQPELKRIKQETKGDRQKEQMMIMQLYKERGINPIGSLPTIAIQFIVLIGLYSGLSHVVQDPSAMVNNAYAWIRNLPWMQTLATDISQFDNTLFGFVDLSKAAISKTGVYMPAMVLVILSAAIQFMTSRQLIPKQKNGRGLRRILKDASSGTSSDQMEVNAAVSNAMSYLIPGMIFLFTVNLPAALSLYWFTGGVVAYFQQKRVLGEDEEEMEALADKTDGTIIEGEIIEKTKDEKAPSKNKKTTKKRRKR